MVDFPVSPSEQAPFPWRAAALVAAAVAGVELLLLVVLGGALVAKPDRAAAHAAKPLARTAPARTAARKTPQPAARAAIAALPRRRVAVMILNGNGRTGAGATAATRVQRRGYRVGVIANAPRQDYPRSIVMYRRGFAGEGERLARDLDIRVVGPLDGMRPRQLHGAHAVVILGG